MSHVAKYDLGLTGAVSKDLMAIAMAAVAATNKGKVVVGKDANVKDTYGNPTKVEISISTPGVPLGVGVDFTSSGPKWVTDSWLKKNQVDSLTAQIKQAYISLAVTTAAKRMGFNFKVKMQNDILSIELEK